MTENNKLYSSGVNYFVLKRGSSSSKSKRNDIYFLDGELEELSIRPSLEEVCCYYIYSQIYISKHMTSFIYVITY